MANENSYSRLWQELQSYLKINVEYAKLTAAEKLAVFISAAAVSLVIFFLAIIFIFFISLAVVNWLAVSIGLAWSYAIMGGLYLVLMALLLIFRKTLIMNPVAKFISKLILK
ncbi:MAG: phage holin family protein [Paramuribaculum sp.]|nr:phage holin family protein [Paramuribaculum sp.]